MSTGWVLPRTLVLLFLLQWFPPCLQGSSTFLTSAFLLTLYFMSSTPGSIHLFRSYLLSPLGTICPSLRTFCSWAFTRWGEPWFPSNTEKGRLHWRKMNQHPDEKKRVVREIILVTFSPQALAVLKLAHTAPLLSLSFPWSGFWVFLWSWANLRFCQNRFELWFCHLHPN